MTIDDYLKEKKRSTKLLDTIKLSHYRAFNQALDTLIGEDSLLDVERLREPAYQEGFADSLDAYYKGASKNLFKSSTEDPLILALMSSAYAGVNREGLLQLIKRENVKLFQENGYINAIPELTKNVEEVLSSCVLSHIKDDDIDPILDYTNTKDMVDRTKVDRIGAIKILNIFDQYGVVPPKFIKKYLENNDN